MGTHWSFVFIAMNTYNTSARFGQISKVSLAKCRSFAQALELSFSKQWIRMLFLACDVMYLEDGSSFYVELIRATKVHTVTSWMTVFPCLSFRCLWKTVTWPSSILCSLGKAITLGISISNWSLPAENLVWTQIHQLEFWGNKTLLYIFILSPSPPPLFVLFSISSHPFFLHLASPKHHLPTKQANAICDSPAITVRSSPTQLKREGKIFYTKERTRGCLSSIKE